MEELDVLPSFTDAPAEEESRRLTVLGRELYAVDSEIKRLETQLAELQERKKVITTKELPDYLRAVGQDKIGLPEFSVDLVMEPYYHANIKAEWAPEKREAAFSYLEKRGDGDLIKTEVSFLFGRADLEKVRWFQAYLKTLQHYLGTEDYMPEPSVQMTVPWNTLTAFVREQVTVGAEIDLDVLGATVGSIVKIKPRKGK